MMRTILGQKTILHIDYESHIRKLARFHIERLRCTYEELDSHKAVESWLRERSKLPDLIIIEILEGKEELGWGTFTMLKKNPLWRDIPIIVLTKLAEDRHVFRG